MRFLVSGSHGFLGSHLCQHLESEGHTVTRLVRSDPGPGEVRWDPYAGPLDPASVEDQDVVVNLAASPTVGNPHSSTWANDLLHSRVTTTRVVAEAIAASERKPAFLAGNAVGIYGDHGDQPVTEETDSRGDALLTRVSRAWQDAGGAAERAGARVVYLRTAPVMDARSMPLKVLAKLFRAGLGGPLGDGTQRMPMVTARDWVDAVTHLGMSEDAAGPFNITCVQAPTNAEFTRELASQVHRPAFFRVPAFVLRPAAGDFAHELLGSVDAKPAALLASGFTFRDPDVSAVLREGLAPSR